MQLYGGIDFIQIIVLSILLIDQVISNG